MSLDLDKRHRAMLREMGVRVWLPNAVAVAEAPVAEAPAALSADSAAMRDAGDAGGVPDPRAAAEAQARAVFGEPTPRVAPPAPVAAPTVARPPPPAPAVPTQRPAAARPIAAAAPMASPGGAAATWRLGEAVALYTGAAEASAGQGARWLVLAETPASTLPAAGADFQPFNGDAGKLLDNMLRAARLHQSAMVLLAPMTRLAAGSGIGPEVDAALHALVEASQPDIVLVMGRLAAQALLRTDQPFGKVRGQVHRLHGTALVATYDAPYLVRNAGDKARAWDDLCLALATVAPAAA